MSNQRTPLRLLVALAAAVVLAAPTTPPAQAATCSVTVSGKPHTYLCGMNVARLGWSLRGKNYTRVFVVGLDHQVYNIYTASGTNYYYNSGWKTLGGYAKNGAWATTYPPPYNDPAYVHLYVIGSDNAMWCRHLVGSTWSPWSKKDYDCQGGA